MIDPSSVLSALAFTVKTLYTLVNQEKDNAEEIARLAAHASSLHVLLSERCSGGIPKNLLPLLEALNLFVTLATLQSKAAEHSLVPFPTSSLCSVNSRRSPILSACSGPLECPTA